MTELEARRIINEARSVCPSFVRGRTLYQVRRDGRTIDVSRLTASGKRAVWQYTTTVDDVCVHPDVRRRLQ